LGEKHPLGQNKKTIEKAQVMKMTSLTNYEEGSIVSRTIIDRKAGTITLFAFDEEQGLSEHVSPYDAIVCVIEGEAEVVISGKVFHVREGEMIIIPAKKPHALKATTKFKMMLTMVRA
jgi:quercetin dioxygenase-like cupin family protein